LSAASLAQSSAESFTRLSATTQISSYERLRVREAAKNNR
jgi:hypothetical protein